MRLETPRFLTEGDTVTLSGIVHNYLEAPTSRRDLDRGRRARSCSIRADADA